MPLQDFRLNTITPEDMRKEHPMFDKSLPDFWMRLLFLDVDPMSLKTEEQRDNYVNAMKDLLKMLWEGSEEEKIAIGAAASCQPPDTNQADLERGIWTSMDKTAWKLVLNMKKMRPSRISQAVPFLNLVKSNPLKGPLAPGEKDVLPVLLMGAALSKPTPENAGREAEARALMVEALAGVGEPGSQVYQIGPRNMIWGWATLARLLRRMGKKKAAEKVDARFLEWLRGHPLAMVPSVLEYEVNLDDFVPTLEEPEPPVQRMLTLETYLNWKSCCQEISPLEMIFEQNGQKLQVKLGMKEGDAEALAKKTGGQVHIIQPARP